MLISWIVLAVCQLSAGELPLIGIGSNTSRPMAPAITPGEPSTLIEALIGITLVAAYLLFARRMRTRRGAQPIAKPVPAGRGRRAA